MKSVLIWADEPNSLRFERLSSALNVDSPGARWQVFGHLTGWFTRWSRSVETDSGIWFGVSQQMIGSWAGVSSEDAPTWGEALKTAGYIDTLKNAYPAPLGTSRRGWVALNPDGGAMFDPCAGLFRKRKDFSTLVLYILDDTTRVDMARRLGLDGESLERANLIPPGWLTPPKGGMAPSRGGHPPGAGWEFNPPPTTMPHQAVAEAQTAPRAITGFSMSAAGRPSDQHTGSPKSFEMLETVRAYRYQDPERALLSMDNTPKARACWAKAVHKDRTAASEILANMVETDETWAKIRNPSSVAMNALRKAGLLE